MAWCTQTLNTEDEVFDRLIRLSADKWYWRGQSRCYGELIPSIDRDAMASKTCSEKFSLERKSINIFRASARSFSHHGEERALTDDIIALAVLRHHGVRTRLLDWSRSPFVAAYFAVCHDDDEDGEIWGFDEKTYMDVCRPQWADSQNWQHEFEKAAFNVNNTQNFFVCVSYPTGFARQNAQNGLYSITSEFGQDHAKHIEKLLEDHRLRTRYKIPQKLKPVIRNRLLLDHRIWDGSLYPDSAGAAKVAGAVFP